MVHQWEGRRRGGEGDVKTPFILQKTPKNNKESGETKDSSLHKTSLHKTWLMLLLLTSKVIQDMHCVSQHAKNTRTHTPNIEVLAKVYIHHPLYLIVTVMGCNLSSATANWAFFAQLHKTCIMLNKNMSEENILSLGSDQAGSS